ncbi:MAG: protein-glutamate O-methyltransferase CheR [Steroidobacteraceae bacterium]|jgi:chemotaxis protein methyltransferase CheR
MSSSTPRAGRSGAPRAVESLDREREFTFELADFDALRDLIKRNTGISLADSKMEMVYGRISRRLRHLKLRSFADYRSMLESDESEWIEFCNAMTTNLTSFFRESHHFDFLRDHVLRPKLSQPGASRRIRIWSAACSSGEEPYSIAMTVIEALPDFKRWDIRILATDIDSQILATARRGVYPTARLEALAPQRVRDHFQPLPGSAGQFRVAPEVASLVTFKQLNLVQPLPMKGPLDAVFCRNVIIYFDKDTQRELLGHIAALQRKDDLLFLGHSESLFKVSEDYGLIGRTIYRRI